MGVLTEIRGAYTPDDAARDLHYSVLARHLFRPVSFFCTVPFASFGWSPNQVTLLRALVSLLSLSFMACGLPSAVLAGAVLYNVAFLLDYVDGNLARLRHRTTTVGEFLERTTDSLVMAVMPAAMALGLFLHPDRVLRARWVDFPAELILIVGVATSGSFFACQLIRFSARIAMLELQLANGGDRLRASETGNNGQRKCLSVRQSLVEFEYLFATVGLLLLALFQLTSVYLAARCLNTAIASACSVSRIIRKMALAQSKHV